MIHTMYQALCYRDYNEQVLNALSLLTHDLVDSV